MRRYPHLRISARGPGPSGTSTHLTRQLSGTRRVGRGGAYALPLPARSNGSCSFPASRFPVRAPLRRRRRIDAGRKVDQPHKSELLHQPWKWILSPHRVSPFLGDERTEPTLNPAIHPMEQFSYVRLPVIVPPAAYDRVDRLDHIAEPNRKAFRRVRLRI